MPRRDIFTVLVYARNHPVVGCFAYYCLKFMGVEIPRSVQIERDFLLVHGEFVVVIHPHALIGDRVKIYPGVTLGRADVHRTAEGSLFEEIVVEDDVVLSPGATVLCKEDVLRVGCGMVVGANATLLRSTGEGEMWTGVLAELVGQQVGVE